MINDHLVRVEQAENSQDEVAEIAELTREDGHVMCLPTDIVWKNGKRIGFFSVIVQPIVSAFFSKKNTLGRDSVSAINVIEQIVKRSTGTKTIIVPVSRTSPFYTQMESLGYKKDETITYFYKNV